MNEINASHEAASQTDATRLYEIVDAFEENWKAGGRPDIHRHLPAEGPLRRSVLIKLVHIDLENRLSAGEKIRVETYLDRHAELAGDAAAILELVAWEFSLRRRREGDLTAEYLRRFPQYSDMMLPCLSGKSNGAEPETLPHAAAEFVRQGEGEETADVSRALCSTGQETLDVPTGSAAASPALPRLPGYDMLGELGRGGMGVVYKALHVSLKRVVALKMILAGGQAGPAELARFHAEAQAVAQLQHPNIVQIYEIGAQDGRPFFCLEYVDGGSLSNMLQHRPQPAERCARMVEVLARAMHYTHQRGIVHRDLKPANVLLARSDALTAVPLGAAAAAGSGRFEPKITDFGLAKQLQDDAGQTVSGAILGTPSYMAPEQAAGKTREVDALADIYALGTILYEMLTGGPPFRGVTHAETLFKVLHEEPVPPSRLVSRVPRDLETICLKALAKEPARRYQSGLTLAQDLERFGAGEPILARREGVLRRSWRKLRRHPLRLAGTAVVLLAVAAVAFFFWSARSAERLAGFAKTFEPRLQKIEWSAQYLDEMEALIAPIEPLDSVRAAEARAELFRQYAKSVRYALSLDATVGIEDVIKIEAALELLKTREPDLEKMLRKELEARTRSMQKAAELRAPFDNAGKVIADGRFHPADKALVSLASGEGFMPLAEACLGNAQMEATFAYPSWGTAAQLGLVLNMRSGLNEGYRFLLSAQPLPPEKGDKKTEPRLDWGRTGAGTVRLKIQRNRVTLRQDALPLRVLSAKPLTLKATREGSTLTMDVLQEEVLLASLRFQESLGVRAAPGVFGLCWPAGIGLEALTLRRQTLPSQPGPLEQADQFLAEGNVETALALYRKQASASDKLLIRQEALCKEAACLLELKRDAEAVALLAPLVSEGAGRWPLVATCELWQLYLLQKKQDDADALADTFIARGYKPEQLAATISDDARRAIWTSLNGDYSMGSFLFRASEQHLRRLERHVELHDYFQTDEASGLFFRSKLARAYRILGQRGRAERLLKRSLLEIANQPGAVTSHFRVAYAVELGWTAREQGDPASMLPTIDALLKTNVSAANSALLVERARLNAALGNFPDAEQDLHKFFDMVNLGGDPSPFASACLLLGFLRERRRDHDGAMEAWGRKHPKAEEKPLQDLGADAIHLDAIHLLMLASLTGKLTEDEAARFQQGLMAQLPVEYRTALSALNIRLSAALLRDMWRTPHGLDSARHIAYEDVPLEHFLKLPPLAGITALIRRDAFGPEISSGQDDLIWELADGVWTRLRQGKLSQASTLQLALAWKGTTNFLGWGGLAPSLEPALRGPLAYVLGHRYLRLAQPKQAAEFFHAAQRDAAAGSTLHKLAGVELAKLPSK